MTDGRLLAEYARQQIVKDRNYVGLLLWSAATVAQPIPEGRPPDDWVRERLIAERIPQNAEYFAARTISYFLQHPATQDLVRELLNPFNSPDVEEVLHQQVMTVIRAIIPRFAVGEIPGAQVAQWLVDNGR